MAKQRLREQIAQEAARLMMEGGIRDFALARRKAANRFGRVDHHALPSDEEIGLARQTWHQLYGGSARADRLTRMRRLAREAMVVFAEFTPLLVGDVVAGTIHENSAIVLQLFAEFPEEVIFKLHSARIPFTEMTAPRRSVKLGAGLPEYSGFGFLVDSVSVELRVYPAHARLPSGRIKGYGAKEAAATLPELLRLLTGENG